jgi:hypothetical protein
MKRHESKRARPLGFHLVSMAQNSASLIILARLLALPE